MGAGASYNQGLRAALDLDDAMDYIDRIYSAQILAIYGVTMALGISTAEFDQMMTLTPKPPTDMSAIFLDVFVSILEKVPIAGEAFEAAKIAGETAHHIAQVIQTSQKAANVVSEASKHFQEDGKQLDALEPDEDQMKVIRSLSTKMPVFQKVLWMRYQVEYDRRAARQRFRNLLRAALDTNTLVGKPLDLARKEFGPAPPDLTMEVVYKQFETVEKQTLRELIHSYVKQYVSVVDWIEHPVTPNPAYENYVIMSGLNQAQWDYIYGRFGKKADQRVEAARRIQSARVVAGQLAKAVGISLKPMEFQEPILSGVEDLWRFWGAKLYKTEHWWYGKSDPFLAPVDLQNAVK
jgi:hypothetical protein